MSKLNLKPDAENNVILDVHLHKPHPGQKRVKESKAKRKVIKAGRRWGKTDFAAQADSEAFMEGHRCLYGAPTEDQVGKYWKEVSLTFNSLIDAGIMKKNELLKFIELTPFGMQVWQKTHPDLSLKQLRNMRIKAKTCWNAEGLRGDYADKLTLDEYQLMIEDAWGTVGVPMLADNDGDATFIYTPPRIGIAASSRARDPRHASKMFRMAKDNPSRWCPKCKNKHGKLGTWVDAIDDICPVCAAPTPIKRWEAFHGTSYENPHIEEAALDEMSKEMSEDAYRREILAEDDDIESSWVVHGKFNERLCKIKRIPIPYNWPVYSGHDFGKSNPGALFIAQNPGPEEPATSTGNKIRKGDYVIFHEYLPGGGVSPSEHALNFKEITKDRHVIRSVGGNANTEDEIRRGYAPFGWVIIQPRISKVNAQLERVYGLYDLNRIHIFDDLTRLLDEMANCLWELDDTGHTLDKIKNEARYHLLACLRYIGSDFAPEVINNRTPNQRNPLRSNDD